MIKLWAELNWLPVVVVPVRSDGMNTRWLHPRGICVETQICCCKTKLLEMSEHIFIIINVCGEGRPGKRYHCVFITWLCRFVAFLSVSCFCCCGPLLTLHSGFPGGGCRKCREVESPVISINVPSCGTEIRNPLNEHCTSDVRSFYFPPPPPHPAHQ